MSDQGTGATSLWGAACRSPPPSQQAPTRRAQPLAHGRQLLCSTHLPIVVCQKGDDDVFDQHDGGEGPVWPGGGQGARWVRPAGYPRSRASTTPVSLRTPENGRHRAQNNVLIIGCTIGEHSAKGVERAGACSVTWLRGPRRGQHSSARQWTGHRAVARQDHLPMSPYTCSRQAGTHVSSGKGGAKRQVHPLATQPTPCMPCCVGSASSSIGGNNKISHHA